MELMWRCPECEIVMEFDDENRLKLSTGLKLGECTISIEQIVLKHFSKMDVGKLALLRCNKNIRFGKIFSPIVLLKTSLVMI